MSNEGYHEPVADLSDATRDMHRAIVSLMEELEAVEQRGAHPRGLEVPEDEDALLAAAGDRLLDQDLGVGGRVEPPVHEALVLLGVFGDAALQEISYLTVILHCPLLIHQVEPAVLENVLGRGRPKVQLISRRMVGDDEIVLVSNR